MGGTNSRERRASTERPPWSAYSPTGARGRSSSHHPAPTTLTFLAYFHLTRPASCLTTKRLSKKLKMSRRRCSRRLKRKNRKGRRKRRKRGRSQSETDVSKAGLAREKSREG